MFALSFTTYKLLKLTDHRIMINSFQQQFVIFLHNYATNTLFISFFYSPSGQLGVMKWIKRMWLLQYLAILQSPAKASSIDDALSLHRKICNDKVCYYDTYVYYYNGHFWYMNTHDLNMTQMICAEVQDTINIHSPTIHTTPFSNHYSARTFECFDISI